jgi:glycosyltransferase involved in cell wall biosynthesis
VLHVCCNYASSSAHVQLFTGLAALGFPQCVYVPEKRREDMGRNLPQDGAFEVLYSLIVRPWDRALYHTKARRAAPDLARRVGLSGVDLVHAHTLFTDGGIAYRLYRERGLPFVVSLRMTDISYFFRYMPHLREHGLRILRAARRVVFLSPAARDALMTRYVPAVLRDELAQKCVVIPNGIDGAWLEGGSPRTWRPGEPLRVAFAGRLERNKQPLRALEAVRVLEALLPGTGAPACASLEVAGRGHLESALRGRPAAKDGLLRLHGRLDGMSALQAFYDGCHLFLMPSLAETFGLVYLEAMSRGLPVLYTRGQGFDGQFAEGEAGFTVDPTDPADMARAALRALDGYTARSARCIALAGAATWERVAERMGEMYSAVGDE